MHKFRQTGIKNENCVGLTNGYFRLDEYFGFRIPMSLRADEMGYIENLLAGAMKPHNMNLLSDKYSGGKGVCADHLLLGWPHLSLHSLFST